MKLNIILVQPNSTKFLKVVGFKLLFWKNRLEKVHGDGIEIEQYAGDNISVTNDTIYGVQFDETEISDILTKIGFIDLKFILNHGISRRHFVHHLVIARKPS